MLNNTCVDCVETEKMHFFPNILLLASDIVRAVNNSLKIFLTVASRT
jgi:hypothetical protein